MGAPAVEASSGAWRPAPDSARIHSTHAPSAPDLAFQPIWENPHCPQANLRSMPIAIAPASHNSLRYAYGTKDDTTLR
jgi:hypothetical protein